MKNIRREGYLQKKYGKYTGDKWNSRKLDRKSSRGMIYENEELRLRTININAEVERGQSDIRKLRRENEQLRREIWSLRDEYDRLNKLLKTHKTAGNEGNNSGSSHTEESDSCDTCKEEDIEEETEDEYTHSKCNKNSSFSKINNQEIVENFENSQKTLVQSNSNSLDASNNGSVSGVPKQRESLHVNFDHLSIVSEENLTSSDGNSVQPGDGDMVPVSKQNSPNHDKNVNRLSDIQSIVPPLSHFENIAYDKLGPTIAPLEDTNCSASTTTTGETVIPANGWDFSAPVAYAMQAGPSSRANSATNPLSSQVTNSYCSSQKSPKHFFSPIKPKIRIEQKQPESSSYSGPDIFVSNALASPYHHCQTLPSHPGTLGSREPLYATVQKNESRALSPLPFQRGGNLEDLLSDIKTLSNDIIQLQLEKQKSHSQEKLGPNENLSKRKPYRSEMNLVLSFNGSNPVITPIVADLTHEAGSQAAMDTPPPNLPEPMILFPQNLTYLGFEGYAQLPANLPPGTVRAVVPGQQQQEQHLKKAEDQYPAALVKFPNDYVHVQIPTPVLCDTPPPSMGDLPAKEAPPVGETPTRTPAFLRRKTFSKKSENSQILRSFENKPISSPLPPATLPERVKNTRVESSTSENANCDVQSSSGSETTKRKSRRVSILFRKSEDKVREKIKEKDQKSGEIPNRKPSPRFSESIDNLTTIVDSDTINRKTVATAAHSTPNSPHSGGRRNNNSHHHHGHHHHHHNHHQSAGRKLSQDLGVKSPTIGQQRAKCSRRHSEGTIMTNLSGGVSSSNHPISDSYQEPGTSVSERNSNSLASSRESSTSLSMRSQRRKISISSHNGGKIPWCGCWGNGCV